MQYTQLIDNQDARHGSSSPFPQPTRSQKTSNRNSALSRVRVLYLLYGFGVFAIIAGSLVFWATSFHRPILFPYSAGRWIKAHVKYTTIFCTIAGALLAAFTVYLLNQILILMSQQVIRTHGASLSTIEVWHRLFNKDFIFDKDRISVSVLTLVFWIAALYLGTAFTSLITPTDVLISDTVSGTEIDFNSSAFWEWYNYRDTQGNFNRTETGCHWMTYSNSKGSITFPACPYNNDPINFLSSGSAAAQASLSLDKPSINYLDKHYEGSTGGTLPVGWAGFVPFNNIEFDHWRDDTHYTDFNYSLSQQGLTVDVTCEETAQTPIAMRYVDYINVTIPGLSDGRLNIVNFTWTCPTGTVASSGESPGKSSSAQIAVPKLSWAQLVICETETMPKEYSIYIGAYGTYATDTSENPVLFPNMTCTMKPKLTDTIVTYTANDNLFRVSSSTPIPGSGSNIPNETYQAVDRAFSLAISNSENMVIDSIHGFASTNSSVNVTAAMEHTIRGYIEFFATNLRMYYSFNEPPGQHKVVGNYTVWRVGYKSQPIVLASLVPPLVLVSALALYYIITGWSSGAEQFPNFNPVDSISMLIASAAGGYAGRFPVSHAGNHLDARTTKMRVKYDMTGRQVIAIPDKSPRQDVELAFVRPSAPNESEDDLLRPGERFRYSGGRFREEDMSSRTSFGTPLIQQPRAAE